MKDVFRVAEFLELPFQWANPDPIVQLPGENGRPRTSDAQPCIERLTRLGVLAEELGAGIEFAEQVAGLIWTTDHWDQGSRLADAVARAGLDLPEMETKLGPNADRLDQIIRQNESAHTAAGHWGVPTMLYEAEPFFGQDRLDVLMWRLLKNGLTRR